MSDSPIKPIDLENLTEDEKNNIDPLIKKIIKREKDRLSDVETAHVSDHRSDHTSELA